MPSRAWRSGRVMRSAAKAAHSASSSAIASNIPIQPFLARTGDNRAAMRARIHEPARFQQPDRFPHRRARHVEATGEFGLIERRAGRERAGHDLIGKPAPQLFDQSAAAAAPLSPIEYDRCSSVLLLDHAHMRGNDPPSYGEANPGLHLPADLCRAHPNGGTKSRRPQRRAHRS